MWSKIKSKWYDFLWLVSGPHAGRIAQETSKEFLEVHDILMEKKMTEKIYFERHWEGEYYIFDSETISEKEFDEKVEYEDYHAFEDSMSGSEVVDRMNALHEEIEVIRDERNYFERKKCEYFNNWNNAHLDNIQLRQENEELKQELFETSKELLWETSSEVDRVLYYEDEVGELRKEIFE